jgi:hypothetical protein
MKIGRVGKVGMLRLVVVCLCIVAVLGVGTCLGDNDGTVVPGDPQGLPPGCRILEPTPVILSDFVAVLAAVVSLAVL